MTVDLVDELPATTFIHKLQQRRQTTETLVVGLPFTHSTEMQTAKDVSGFHSCVPSA